MNYKLKNWIETAKWQGALIENEDGRLFLTSGIIIWETNESRHYKIIDSIDDETKFFERWKEQFPYCESDIELASLDSNT